MPTSVEPVAIGLDSSPENRREKEFNNRRARFRRQGDRRSVEWLCRRDGRQLRACWPACDGCRGGGESGCWRECEIEYYARRSTRREPSARRIGCPRKSTPSVTASSNS